MPDTDLFLQLAQKRPNSPTSQKSSEATKKQAPEAPKTALEAPETPEPVSEVLKTVKEAAAPSSQPAIKPRKKPVLNEVTTAVMVDVVTSLLQGINKKSWRETIENTEAHNSSLRMSAEEKEQIEDVVRELKRTYKIKTSINEIARLGLLVLTHDFHQRGEKSIITGVKKS